MTSELMAVVTSAAAAYALAGALITMLPGPDTAVVLATAIDQGRQAAVRAAFGVAVGLLFWTTAASVGLAAILRASAEVYTVFRIVCVGYLIWLAFRAFRSALRRPDAVETAKTVARSRIRLPWGFRRALLTAVLNPKLGVFFVVVLPQFIPEGTSPFAMTMLFGTIQACEALLWYLILGGIAARARGVLSRARIRRALDLVTGALFALFGVRVALDVLTIATPWDAFGDFVLGRATGYERGQA